MHAQGVAFSVVTACSSHISLILASDPVVTARRWHVQGVLLVCLSELGRLAYRKADGFPKIASRAGPVAGEHPVTPFLALIDRLLGLSRLVDHLGERRGGGGRRLP